MSNPEDSNEHTTKLLISDSDRMKALTWWRGFQELDKVKFAKLVFPNKSFIEVSTSSNSIEKIWNTIIKNGKS